MRNARSITSAEERIAGLDALRLLGAGLVTLQHILSLGGWNDVWLVATTPGTVGVALFFGISGLLATQTSTPPLRWLGRRLSRIYPAFVIVTAGGFLLAWMSGYKSFHTSQVVCQLAGIGYFTHAGQLVNVATWFISLLLALYVSLALIRATGYPMVGYLAAALICIAMLLTRTGGIGCAGAAVFWSSAAIGESVERKHLALTLLLSAGAFGLVGILVPQMISGSIALFLLSSSVAIPSSASIVSRAADATYEFYLVHGIALVAAFQVFGQSVVAAVAGVLLGLCAAMLLRRVMLVFESTIVGKWRLA